MLNIEYLVLMWRPVKHLFLYNDEGILYCAAMLVEEPHLVDDAVERLARRVEVKYRRILVDIRLLF